MGQFYVNESGEDIFTLTASAPRHLDPNNSITVSQTTTLTTFTAAQYSGIRIFLFNAANANIFLNGQSASGYLLTPNGNTGLDHVTVPAGTWYIGVYDINPISGSQSVRGFDEVSAITFRGQTPINNIPMKTGGDAGAWAQKGFKVKGSPKLFLETEASGGKYVIMTKAQFKSFDAAYPNGYTGGSYNYITWSHGQGQAATEIETQLKLPDGKWNLVWINDTGGWAGGGANITAYAKGGTGRSNSASKDVLKVVGVKTEHGGKADDAQPDKLEFREALFRHWDAGHHVPLGGEHSFLRGLMMETAAGASDGVLAPEAGPVSFGVDGDDQVVRLSDARVHSEIFDFVL